MKWLNKKFGWMSIEMVGVLCFVIAYPFFFYEYQRTVDRWVMDTCNQSGLMFYDAKEEAEYKKNKGIVCE